jgi:hypothetical protein
MQTSPDFFLNAQNSKNFQEETTKISDFVHKITFELAQNT